MYIYIYIYMMCSKPSLSLQCRCDIWCFVTWKWCCCFAPKYQWQKQSIQQPRRLLPLSWWRHQMETFSALLAFCAGNSPVPVNSPHKGQWRGALMFSLIYVWINAWVNNREAGDLRRHRGHYDVIVMLQSSFHKNNKLSFNCALLFIILVLRPYYSGWTNSISWFLISWILT